ncbi:MAG: SDR family NAD(P)-dependent oxidoreductase, partial [Proteobacteria bacterium]|nr:SDR family NAD(P)-dependent oxidoreductase [Pseudomonadota bacterium]
MSEQEPKVCLVTGASRGIGKAIAAGLGKAGFIVVGTATSDSGANAITKYLKEAGISGRGEVLNVNDAENVSSLFSGVTEAYGAPLVLVNNAGITRDNLLMRMKEDEW